MNIPYNMIHIWIGPLEPPLQWMNTWKEKHPKWNYRIFNNDELNSTKFINQHLIDEYLKREKYAGVADLIRYELLYKEGGFLPPGDALCYENTEELFVEDSNICYTVYESETLRPGFVSPIYACNSGNSFVKTIIERLNLLSPDDLLEPWQSTGNLFLKELISETNPLIKIFPSHYFIPQHFKSKKRYKGNDKVYSDQMWGSTKKTYNKGV